MLPDSRILITNNGQLVNFTTLYLGDEQYYACGVILNNKLQIVNQYYLFVRGKKSLLFRQLQNLAKYFGKKRLLFIVILFYFIFLKSIL